MKKLYYFLCMSLLLLALVGCNILGPTQYKLIMHQPVGQGTVVPEPGVYNFVNGAEVVLSANASTGWQFVRWEVNGSEYSVGAETTLKMNEAKTARAFFEEIPLEVYTLTMLEPEGNGTVVPAVGNHAYEEGTSVNIEAIPDEGWEFIRWEVDRIEHSTLPETTLSMDQSKTVKAFFEEINTNHSPTISIPDQVVEEGNTLTLDLNEFAEDYDDDPLTFELTSGVGTIAESTYRFSTRCGDAGEYTVVITVSDINGSTDEDTFRIVVEEDRVLVGGIIWEDTTWEADQCYYLSDNVQIHEDATLTIEPGVTVVGNDMMMQVWGKLIVEGDEDNHVEIFSTTITGEASYDDEFCISISNAFLSRCEILPPGNQSGHGSLKLLGCRIEDLDQYVYIWYPKSDCFIEGNTFVGFGGFSIGTDDATVFIRNNFFSEPVKQFVFPSEFVVQNWASYNDSNTVVEFNTFADTDSVTLKLKPGYDAAAMIGTQNYWSTTDQETIQSMIFDRTDDLECAGIIPYEPFLIEPHPDTPTP